MAHVNTGFRAHRNWVLACHITGVYDANRSMVLEDDTYELVREWADSVAAHKVRGIIFHNNFSAATCDTYQNEYVSFVKVNYNPQFNPNVYRYCVYRDFLNHYVNELDGVFVTDVSDVVMVQNPFIDAGFTANPSVLFCGDEPKILNNEWMQDHSAHLRNQIPDFADYETRFGNETLLNCGIIGGNASLMFDFITRLWSIHQHANYANETAFTGDMGAFNYLVRTQFNEQLSHGEPVNTVFKMYENERKDCWFRHK
jgi:hypothetical protein